MRARSGLGLALWALVSASATASAQDVAAPVPATAAAAEPGSGAHWEPMPMGASGTDPRLERRMSSMGASRHREGLVGSIYVGVPIANDVDRDVVRPGGSLDFRGGFDLGYFVPELETGFMAWPVKASKLDPVYDDEPLKHFYFGVGARLQIPNRTLVLPYVSGAFDFQFWNQRETRVVCDPWYCWEQAAYHFTPGFTGRAGLAFELARHVALDLNLRVGMAFEGQVFSGAQSWVQPSLGVTFMR